MLQLIEGLTYLKEKLNEIPQGTIKPNNIFITHSKCLKIDYLNFNEFFSLNQEDPTYLAPELKKGNNNQEFDEKSDVWSVGAIYYFLLHGKPPFPKEALIYPLEIDSRINDETNKNLNDMLECEISKRISWKEAIKFFKSDPSENATTIRNGNTTVNEEEEQKHDLTSYHSYGLEQGNNELNYQIDELVRLTNYIGFLIQFVKNSKKSMEFEERDLAIVVHFLRNMVLARFIETLDAAQLDKNEEKWKEILNLLIEYNKFESDSIEIIYNFLNDPNPPKLPINDIIDMLNPKFPKNQMDFGVILKSSLGDGLIKSVQTKLKDPFLVEKTKKNIESLETCLGILLDLPQQIKEDGKVERWLEDRKKTIDISSNASEDM